MMKQISKENLVKMLSLPRIGRKTALKLIKELGYNISSDKELIDFIKESAEKYRLPKYTKKDFEIAFARALNIISDSEKSGIKIITYQDEKFPSLLLKTEDHPILLNYIGDISKLNALPSVAIIGTREATEFGTRIGIRLGEFFGSNGFNIISGLAIGCDTAGHKGALKGNGVTTAVLAHGLDKIYPKENTKLSANIVEKGGVLISEYLIYESPRPNYFVERDRIQAGISLGVIVVETGIIGGTMHTVNYCLSNNRILAAVNHPIDYLLEPKVQGNQQLIKEGKAHPIFEKNEVNNLYNNLLEVFKKQSITGDLNINEPEPKSIKKNDNKLNSEQIKIRLWD